MVGDGAGYVQADYGAMTPRWQAATESPLGPRVWALSPGSRTPGTRSPDGRECRGLPGLFPGGLMSNAEDVRLMYVATTRARDHLVLSLRRSADGRGERTRAAAISRHLADSPHLWEPAILQPVPLPPDGEGEVGYESPAAASDEHTIDAYERWERERNDLVMALSRPSYAAATGLRKPNVEDKPEQEHVEPWRRGRAGTSVGRAVHAVLQSIDLATGDGLEERARAQAAAEGIPGREGEIAGLARVAVESSIVRRAVASGRLWREVPVAVPIGNGSLQGFIDLLFEEPDGLVVVDYKTDSIVSDETREAIDRYRLQGGLLRPCRKHSDRHLGQGSGLPVSAASSGGAARGCGAGHSGSRGGRGAATAWKHHVSCVSRD